MPGIRETVADAARPVVEENGCELLEVSYVREGAHQYLRLVIDKRGGVTVEDCERVSRQTDALIEEVFPSREPYIFEVTSPGLDRPLKTDRDIWRHTGEEVEVRLYAPRDGKKAFEGILKGLDETGDVVILQNGEQEFRFSRKETASLKRTIKF